MFVLVVIVWRIGYTNRKIRVLGKRTNFEAQREERRKKMAFVHLQHQDFSILDGASRVPDYGLVKL